MTESERKLDIVIVGASGDLARKKIFPALFSLYSQGYLPDDQMNIYGFARSEMSDEQFRNRISEHLLCRYVPGEDCASKQKAFLSQCRYVRGDYSSRDSFLDLFEAMKSDEDDAGGSNRLFFFAVPPAVFLDVASALGGAGMVHCGSENPWSRAVVEKPFGKDRASSDKLVSDLRKVFSEQHTFRIDHYLGKEAIQNLMVLRFANAVFEPLWCNKHIESVDLVWKENFGCEGRGGYFDDYGIIRDVMQNHLMQVVALAAMERPDSLKAVRDAKVALLRDVRQARLEDAVLGQYGPSADGRIKGYLDDDTVPADSRTVTFASIRLWIDNERWRGVPFTISAGKALDEKVNELRVRFKDVKTNIFCGSGRCPEANELIIRIQPDEGIFLRLNSKVPGMGVVIEPRDLDMEYHEAFKEVIPDAYERLLLDVIAGERELFIRSDELEAAWDIFTPLLHEIDRSGLKPVIYPYGSCGPEREGE